MLQCPYCEEDAETCGHWDSFGDCRFYLAPKAQWEIRQYADAVGALVAERFPRTWALFEKENSYGGE